MNPRDARQGIPGGHAGEDVNGVVRGLCGAGTGPCGNPGARLFPMGWRYEAHKPGEPVTVTRPPLVIAVRLDVCGCGGPLLSPLDGPTWACPDCASSDASAA